MKKLMVWLMAVGLLGMMAGGVHAASTDSVNIVRFWVFDDSSQKIKGTFKNLINLDTGICYELRII